MIGGDWFAPSRNRTVFVVLLIAVVALMVMHTQTAPVQLSTWSGNLALNQEAAVVGIAGAAVQTGRGTAGNVPFGNPLGVPNAVMTQGYGVGTHAPAHIWGGVDLAIDSTGNGQADPQGTWGAPIYATHGGIAKVVPNSWPGGNYVAIEGDGYKTAYAHLQEFAVQDGQRVERGQVIGSVGSTGMSSGPHLHYEVWKDGVNVNPLEYGALEGTR